MSSIVPGWIVALIGVMCRFVVGGFGVSPPHPWRTTLCGPFWVALLGCTVGLPIVLFGWTIRLIFGKGRAERMWSKIDGWLVRPREFLKKRLVILYIVAMSGLTLALIGAWLYKYGWLNTVLFLIAVVGGSALLIGLAVGAATAGDKLQEKSRRNRSKPSKEKRQNPVWGWSWALVKIVTWLPKIILIVIWQILAFFGLIIVALYKKFCPIEEFP